jgi:hypothetical protein
MEMLFLRLLVVLGLLLPSFMSAAYSQEPSSMLEFKGQKQSSTKWGDLPIESFLSFRHWKEETDLKAMAPNWEKIIRERSYRELAGRVFQCVGTCRVDRGESFFSASYRTGLYEGDEFQTIGDSYAWIFLLDGTMIRLSPDSSVTINELNIGVKENFINARVNTGNVLWLSRLEFDYEEVNIRETDVIFYPYAEYEALPVTEKKPYREDDLISLLEESSTQENHYKSLNEKINENNKLTKQKPTYAFIVMPNANIMGYSPMVEMVSILGGKSYFKKRSLETLGLKKKEGVLLPETFLALRGYDNKALQTIAEDAWFTIDERGREVSQGENEHWLTMGEFITKRIPSIIMGREIFLKRYSEFAFREKYDPLKLALNDGYRLWGALGNSEGKNKEDLELRLEFLKEYFRRVETTNLTTSRRFKERLSERGEKISETTYSNRFFVTALNKYYTFSNYTDDKETGEVLNSTNKLLWKKMHGIR